MKKDYLLPLSILTAAIIIAGVWIYTTGLRVSTDSSRSAAKITNSVPSAQKNVSSSGGGCGL